MAHRSLDPALMRRALELLDARLEKPTRLVIGGGAAMALAYAHTIATQAVDAFTAKGAPRWRSSTPPRRTLRASSTSSPAG